MAKQVIQKLLDDLDGGEADETVSFAMDGIQYEIDLSSMNASKFRELMSPYQEAGTRIGRLGNQAQLRSYRSSVPLPSTPASRELNQKIRLWANSNGYELSERGRIPQHIQDAYNTGTPHPDKAAADAAAKKAAALKDEAQQTPPPARKRTAKKATAASFSS